MKTIHVYENGQCIINNSNVTKYYLNGKEINQAVISCLINDYNVNLNVIKKDLEYITEYYYTTK